MRSMKMQNRVVRQARIVLVCAFLLSTLFAMDTRAEDKFDACRAMALFAETVMKARQKGVAMDVLVDAVMVGSPSADPKMKSLMLTIIQYAYKVPRYSFEENQKRAMIDFRSAVYGLCLSMAQEQEKKERLDKMDM